MDHDRCPKGLAGHKRRLGAWRREMAFRTVLLMAAIGYAVVVVALAHHVPLR
ncbi:hypothetical protein [Pseudoxanthomonas mexicana]|uniref:hypothetical protein n=1 Tax=Pseudoxanthomonas mexicana TaxID=128785 RepID=UPI001FD716D4|nr:hypothetical protein [Pseudoxanthomonas mexicana]UOV00592.1 hypothetical protein MUU73_11305 [Pseudoxanthomonas mexicana]